MSLNLARAYYGYAVHITRKAAPWVLTSALVYLWFTNKPPAPINVQPPVIKILPSGEVVVLGDEGPTNEDPQLELTVQRIAADFISALYSNPASPDVVADKIAAFQRYFDVNSQALSEYGVLAKAAQATAKDGKPTSFKVLNRKVEWMQDLRAWVASTEGIYLVESENSVQTGQRLLVQLRVRWNKNRNEKRLPCIIDKVKITELGNEK